MWYDCRRQSLGSVIRCAEHHLPKRIDNFPVTIILLMMDFRKKTTTQVSTV